MRATTAFKRLIDLRRVAVTDVNLLAEGNDWKTAMRQRALSVRDVLSRHRWAIVLRTPNSAQMRAVSVALPGRWELPNKRPMCARLFAQ